MANPTCRAAVWAAPTILFFARLRISGDITAIVDAGGQHQGGRREHGFRDPSYSSVASRCGLPRMVYVSRCQLRAKACIAASRVGSYPCVGLPSSWLP
jgi:hypothetical protein